jgi:hypothetical protein
MACSVWGGKKRSMSKAIMPYATALRNFRKCENEDFFYAPGAKQLCRFKMMLYKRQAKLEARSFV